MSFKPSSTARSRRSSASMRRSPQGSSFVRKAQFLTTGFTPSFSIPAIPREVTTGCTSTTTPEISGGNTTTTSLRRLQMGKFSTRGSQRLPTFLRMSGKIKLTLWRHQSAGKSWGNFFPPPLPHPSPRKKKIEKKNKNLYLYDNRFPSYLLKLSSPLPRFGYNLK